MDKATQVILRGEYEELVKSNLWKRFLGEVDGKIKLLLSDLEQNPQISEPITRGQAWQECVRALKLVKLIPEKIINPPNGD